jgi:hypothetical protein
MFIKFALAATQLLLVLGELALRKTPDVNLN